MTLQLDTADHDQSFRQSLILHASRGALREVQGFHMHLGKTVLAICHRLKDIEQSQNPRCAIARRKLMDGTPSAEKPIKNSLWPKTAKQRRSHLRADHPGLGN